MDDAVNMELHFILQHLDKSGTYVRLLFVDFSLAFNTIIPTLLQTKLTQLSVPSSICQWITNFLTDRQQLVKLGKFMSNSCTTSTGAPQGCVLSPLLFSLYTNDCTSTDPSVTLKTVEVMVDFRKRTPLHSPPLTIMNSTVPTMESFRFLGTTISQDLKWDTHIAPLSKRPNEELPSAFEEVQSATGAANTVLLSHHQVCSVHFYNCLVWLSYKIRHQKTTENGSDC
ncbi:hypothetical protein QTP86_003271 [Hemibagrus guttatus]|nr:hypothetical protein QTP86_003271 [Hemibagrus guttatus]